MIQIVCFCSSFFSEMCLCLAAPVKLAMSTMNLPWPVSHAGGDVAGSAEDSCEQLKAALAVVARATAKAMQSFPDVAPEPAQRE